MRNGRASLKEEISSSDKSEGTERRLQSQRRPTTPLQHPAHPLINAALPVWYHNEKLESVNLIEIDEHHPNLINFYVNQFFFVKKQ